MFLNKIGTRIAEIPIVGTTVEAGQTVIVTLAETEIGRETGAVREVAATGAESGPGTETAAVIGTLTAGSHAERGTAAEMTTGAVDATAIAAESRVGIDLVRPGYASPFALCFLASIFSFTKHPSRSRSPQTVSTAPFINHCATTCHSTVVLVSLLLRLCTTELQHTLMRIVWRLIDRNNG